MSVLCAGTIVGFNSNEWDMTDRGGGKGVTHSLSVSTGDATEVIKVPQRAFDTLGADVPKLRQFGRPVVVRCAPKAQDSDYGAAKLVLSLIDIEFCKMLDLKVFGYEMEQYVEEPDPTPETPPLASVPNGAKATAKA